MANKDDVSESGRDHGQLVGLTVKGYRDTFPASWVDLPVASHTCAAHACFGTPEQLSTLI